jgi:hypothetical protein
MSGRHPSCRALTFDAGWTNTCVGETGSPRTPPTDAYAANEGHSWASP